MEMEIQGDPDREEGEDGREDVEGPDQCVAHSDHRDRSKRGPGSLLSDSGFGTLGCC